MTENVDVLAATAERKWMAYHIFYGGNPQVLLEECVLPLVCELEHEGLVVKTFYINYWLEGGHVRLRLLPRDDKAVELIDVKVMTVTSEYLSTSPSMHPMARLLMGSYYEDMFAMEYGEEDRPRYFNKDGSPRLCENNTIERRDYEPEWGRYGGQVGMVISEDFFADSTKLAHQVIQLGNAGTRTILLGLAAEIMAVTVSSLFMDRTLTEAFLHGYHARWAGSYGIASTYAEEVDKPRYRNMVRLLRGAVLPMVEMVLDGRGSELPGFLGEWASTCDSYRERIAAAADLGALVFMDADNAEVRPTEHAEAVWRLCHSYVHMTNNRLMVSIEDEAYLAFELLQALQALPRETAA